MDKFSVAIVGPLGAVGQQIISILEERRFPVREIKFFGSKSNHGKKVIFNNKSYPIEIVDDNSFLSIDLAFFCVNEEISKALMPMAILNGTTVIDNSSAWRMEKHVPLVIPEVNPYDLDWNNGIVSNPNCSTIQMLVALKPIHDLYKIKRVVISTYQAVSGTGKNAIIELDNQATDYIKEKNITNSVYPHQILFNVIPHIDDFLEDGYTKEEMKLVNETNKILDENIKVTATAVRIPVFLSHCESVNIETEQPIDIIHLIDVLKKSPGIKVLEDLDNNVYPMPINTSNKDEVFVGRIRRDISIPNGLNLWIVADNLRKGAALNAVQIAEALINRELL